MENRSAAYQISKDQLFATQTSGGLLISVSNIALGEFEKLMKLNGLDLNPIGKITNKKIGSETIVVK